MSFESPAFVIPRQSLSGQQAEWVKIFDPPSLGDAGDPLAVPPVPPAPLPTPELLEPTNPVPEVMAAAGFRIAPAAPHTVERDLLHGLRVSTWDGLKDLEFYTFRESGNATLDGNYPAGTIRVPRGVVFHGLVEGHGPPPHTIHWHGIEPTPLNDGVGHCSMELGFYTYQWMPNFIGTYFYHCHRNTVQHFEFGLFGLLLIEPPDAFFATQDNSAIPIGHCRDGKRRTATNLAKFPSFPGFNPNNIDAPDPLGQFATDPHAMTVPYEVEALWVLDGRDSRWSDMAPNARATFPEHGDNPGVNDHFHENPGRDGFFAFNDFHSDYFFVTGVPVPAPVGGTGTISAGVTIPPAANSGVSGTQVSIEAQVDQTILIRCLDAAYNKTRITFPVDATIIAWDGRALGVPPYGMYNEPYLLKANTPIVTSTARRFDALLRESTPISSAVVVEFLDTRGDDKLMTARIPINIMQTGPFSISGKVTNQFGRAIAGLSVTLSGDAGRSVTVDRFGAYRFDGLAGGSYTVTPEAADFMFSPPPGEVVIDSSSQAGLNFTGTQMPGTFKISGKVISRLTGRPMAGVTVSLSGAASQSVLSDIAGHYTFTGLDAGRYTVTASRDGAAFVPSRANVVVRNGNAAGPIFRGL
ncbi:MAG: carboxypeptidase regulatory-like domain-containing protein [Chloroflexi bacterium]|nr:carboxypeptidase regulatory-like domain-containing protein [Chloroflexota bacterium]